MEIKIDEQSALRILCELYGREYVKDIVNCNPRSLYVYTDKKTKLPRIAAKRVRDFCENEINIKIKETYEY